VGIRTPTLIVLAVLLCGFVPSSLSQRPNPVDELRRRAEVIYFQQRVDSFVEDTFELYEISGELISFRVHPNMTRAELDLMDEKAEDLEDKAGDLISFVRFVSPIVRGNTDGLWVILEPLDENSTMEARLTLLLSLVNGIQPKLEHFVEILTEAMDPAVEVEDLVVEASLPFLIAGGLEELREMAGALRRTL
jgi:hypothetical protein